MPFIPRPPAGALWCRKRSLLCCLLAMVTTAGCGSRPRTVRAWGEVRWQDQPVEEGVIVFRPIDGTAGPSTGGPIAAGRYDVAVARGLRAGGVYRVEITAAGGSRVYSPNASGAGDRATVREELLPARYHRDSELQARVATGAADHRQDFDLD